jgi:hypothetical protein
MRDIYPVVHYLLLYMLVYLLLITPLNLSGDFCDFSLVDIEPEVGEYPEPHFDH